MQSTHDRLIEMLTSLKLTAIRDQLDTLLGELARQDLALPEVLAMLCERELGRKHERRIEMGLSIAKFPAVRELAAFDFTAQPSLDARQIKELAGRQRRDGALAGPAGCGQDASGGGARPRGGGGRLQRAVHAGDDPGGAARQGACRRPARGSAVATRQAEAAHHRRARLSAVRAERGALVLPAGQPALRAGQHDDHVQSPSWRVGHRVWRPGGGDRHPRSSSAPQPCDHHPRRPLPAEREAPRGPRAEAAGRRDGRGQSMTQVDQFFMSPPDQFLMSFDTPPLFVCVGGTHSAYYDPALEFHNSSIFRLRSNNPRCPPVAAVLVTLLASFY